MSKKNKKKNVEIEYVAPIGNDKASEDDNSKNETNIKKGKKFSYFAFTIKIIAVAILITFGVLMLWKSEDAQFAILLVTGICAIILALIRIFTIVIRTNYKRTRLLALIEIAVHCLIGLYLVFAAYKFKDDSSSGFADFNIKNYHYFLAVILYTRALVYFWVTILYHEPTKKNQFWIHVTCMTLGCVIAGLNNFTPKEIAYTLAILAFVGAVVIGVETGVGYFKYRKSVAPVKEKKKEDKKDDNKELPGEDKKPYEDPKTEDEPIIDPTINDNNNDQPNDVV